MTPEEIAAKHCRNGHDAARCALLSDLRQLTTDTGLFKLSCGCQGRIVDRCAIHPDLQFSDILLDQQPREADRTEQVDGENRHLKIILGKIAVAIGATGTPFEELPGLVAKNI